MDQAQRARGALLGWGWLEGDQLYSRPSIVEPLQYTSPATSLPPSYDSLPALSRYSYALTLKVYNQDTDGKEKSNISC